MIYGLDPGLLSGIVAFDGRNVHFAKILPESDLLALLRNSAQALENNLVAIEMIGHYGTGMPAGKTVFDTCLTIGRCIEICEQAGATVQLILRATIKAHLCGSPRAKDGNVARALMDKYGEKGTKAHPGPLYGFTSHLFPALAVADYAIAHPPAERMSGG